MKKPINVPVKTILTIPDQSGVWKGDTCHHSMWGTYRGIGDVHRFYCSQCQMIITANFPRWSRTLKKYHQAMDVINTHWACPGCCKTTSNLIYMDEEHWGWEITKEEKRHGTCYE